MSDLVRFIYVSAASEDFQAGQLMPLLQKARAKNPDLGLTGMLLYTEGSFFQVLEGPSASVHTLYEQILADSRHSLVTKVVEEPIDQRDFEQWTMGFSELSRSDLTKVIGANDFFRGSSCFHGLDEGRAKRVLESFRDGGWRKTLS